MSKFEYRIRIVKKPGKSKRFYPEYKSTLCFGFETDWENFLYKNDKKIHFNTKKKVKKFLDKEIENDMDYTYDIENYPYKINKQSINIPLDIEELFEKED